MTKSERAQEEEIEWVKNPEWRNDIIRNCLITLSFFIFFSTIGLTILLLSGHPNFNFDVSLRNPFMLLFIGSAIYCFLFWLFMLYVSFRNTPRRVGFSNSGVYFKYQGVDTFINWLDIDKIWIENTSIEDIPKLKTKNDRLFILSFIGTSLIQRMMKYKQGIQLRKGSGHSVDKIEWIHNSGGLPSLIIPIVGSTFAIGVLLSIILIILLTSRAPFYIFIGVLGIGLITPVTLIIPVFKTSEEIGLSNKRIYLGRGGTESYSWKNLDKIKNYRYLFWKFGKLYFKDGDTLVIGIVDPFIFGKMEEYMKQAKKPGGEK